jgi:ribonuclease T
MSENAQLNGLCDRFRGFYPVVIDVETAGFNAKTDALLEIAAITLKMDEHGWLMPDETLHFHVEPFEGANLQPEALAFNGINPHDPQRGAVSEYDALHLQNGAQRDERERLQPGNHGGAQCHL